MTLKLTLNVAPISLNHYNKITTRGKFATKYKTAEAAEFEKNIEAEIYKHMREIKLFNDAYDSKKHYIVAEYKFYLPFFTKKKMIAKRKHDVDNFIKTAQDNIFGYFKADDSEVISLTATKIHSEERKIIATYHVKQLSTIQ